MDTRILEYFLTAAQEGNFTRAAEILRVSQPSLSRQIMQLEEEIGCPLFIRGSKSVQLTAEGFLFKNRAEEILSLVQKTRKELLNEKDYIRGDIYLGTMESGAFRSLADLIVRFRARYPGVCFHIASEQSAVISHQVEQGLFDFGFLLGPVSGEKFHSVAIPASERWGILLLPDHPLAGRDSLAPSDLQPYPLIVPERLLKSGSLASLLGRPKDFQIAAAYNLISNILILAEAGAGAVLCLYRKQYTEKGFRFIPLSPGRLEEQAFFIWKKGHTLSQASDRFLKEVCDSFSESHQS